MGHRRATGAHPAFRSDRAATVRGPEIRLVLPDAEVGDGSVAIDMQVLDTIPAGRSAHQHVGPHTSDTNEDALLAARTLARDGRARGRVPGPPANAAACNVA